MTKQWKRQGIVRFSYYSLPNFVKVFCKEPCDGYWPSLIPKSAWREGTYFIPNPDLKDKALVLWKGNWYVIELSKPTECPCMGEKELIALTSVNRKYLTPRARQILEYNINYKSCLGVIRRFRLARYRFFKANREKL